MEIEVLLAPRISNNPIIYLHYTLSHMSRYLRYKIKNFNPHGGYYKELRFLVQAYGSFSVVLELPTSRADKGDSPKGVRDGLNGLERPRSPKSLLPCCLPCSFTSIAPP